MALPRISSRYDLQELLGQGGMGIVYRAYDSNRKGFVALKTMRDAADESALDLFTQEWRTLANISHPNIVDVLDSGEYEEDGQRRPYFVMPLLPGRTLDKVARESSRRLPVDRIVEILIQTCRGLHAAHAAGLVHRDLKPSNLFVMNDDSVKIIDFGMVHLTDVKKSVTGVKGTLQYMSPEQLEMKEVTPATDIFSLGVVAFEVLTGRNPFERATVAATAHAIRNEAPPPASDLNPAVGRTLAQVVAKAMAKNPWNRYPTAKEFSEHLSRAMRGEAIEAFEAARILPRMERARKALQDGDFDYANEILTELQFEGHVDAEISSTLEQVKVASRNKAMRLLLDSAKTRMEEDELPLAWQKVQEALQRDPGNAEALALQAEIDTRRNDQQIEKWRRLVQQHLHNHAFSQARQAIDELRKLSRNDLDVADLNEKVDRSEAAFQQACEQKEQEYQSAVALYGNGEVSTALFKLEKVLELDAKTPGCIQPGRDQVYRETYEKIRNEWKAVRDAVSEVERVIASGDYARASSIAAEFASKYGNDTGLQALKLRAEDLLRQERSAYIAEIAKRLDEEPDLDTCVQYLEEALKRYPAELTFQERAVSLRKKRDLVNSIAAKARHYEEQNLPVEALGQWNMLRGIHPKFPGLEFEIERAERCCEQQKRDAAKLEWVNQVDRLLQSSDFDRAKDIIAAALEEFPGDQELTTLERLADEGSARSVQAAALLAEAEAMTSEKRFGEAIEILRQAMTLDANGARVRSGLADALAGQAQTLLPHDWKTADALIQEALHLAPAHGLAKSLRPSVLLAKRAESVDQWVSQARGLQASGDVLGALAKTQEALAAHPNDERLRQLQGTLQSTVKEQPHLRRRRDLDSLKQLSATISGTTDPNTMREILDRTVALSRAYPGDDEFTTLLAGIKEQARREEPETVVMDRPPVVESPPPPPPPGPPPGTEPVAAPVPAPAGAAKKRLPWVLGGAAAGLAILGVLVLILVMQRRTPPPATAPGVQVVTMQFSTTPNGARIAVDGRPIEGNSVNVSAGSHTVSASLPGYKTVTQTFDAAPGAPRIDLALLPEPQIIRISADMPAGKVLLDGVEVGSLQEGMFTFELSSWGPHVLKLTDGRNDVLTAEFRSEIATPARLTAPVVVRNMPVVIVSNLGAQAFVHTSITGMQAFLKTGEAQPVPPEGKEFQVQPGNNELTVTDGKQPLVLAIDQGNAPVLSIRAGSSHKGVIRIETAADNAEVWINGRKSSRRVKNGVWVGQYDPGDYKVRLTLDGYEDSPERPLTVAAGKTATSRFDLNRAVTTATLAVQGGTPEAEVFVDDRLVGRLDAGGGLAGVPIAPDVEHNIRFQRENHESREVRRRGSVKETVLISGADAVLKPFGTLVLEVQPSDAQVTIQRRGDAPRRVTERTLRVREGTYTVSVNGGPRYQPFEKNDVTVAPGQTRTVPVVLTRREEPAPVAAAAPKPRGLTDLFENPDNWKPGEKDFLQHEGSAFLKSVHYNHTFDFFRIKKPFGRREKIEFRIYNSATDYVRYEIDGDNLTRTEMSGKTAKPSVKKPHGLSGDVFRVSIKTEPERITVRVGQVTDTVAAAVAGRTAFDGKYAVRLVD